MSSIQYISTANEDLEHYCQAFSGSNVAEEDLEALKLVGHVEPEPERLVSVTHGPVTTARSRWSLPVLNTFPGKFEQGTFPTYAPPGIVRDVPKHKRYKVNYCNNWSIWDHEHDRNLYPC